MGARGVHLPAGLRRWVRDGGVRLPGLTPTVCTALTDDREGHGADGAGIPVDVPIVWDRFLPDGPDVALLAADRTW